MTQHAVFLSYNSVDEAAVTEIAHRLRARAIEPWLRRVARRGRGQPWQAALERALREARAGGGLHWPERSWASGRNEEIARRHSP
jgi:hypothetical protein